MASWPNFEPARLLRRLVEAEVDFVVIGGVAVVVQGNPRLTRDLDISYATDTENLDRLAGVLVSIGARLSGVDEDVGFVPDARTLRRVQTLTLSTHEGNLDLLVDPPGAPSYGMLRRRSDVIDLAGVSVRIASRSDLIAMKHAAGRPQDLIDIAALEVAQARNRREPRPSGGRRRRGRE